MNGTFDASPGSGRFHRVNIRLQIPTLDGICYARIPMRGHWENHRIDSVAMQEWLRAQLYKHYQSPLNTETLKQVVETLKTRAKLEGPEHQVYVRIAALPQAIYVDLGGPDWKVVEVTPSTPLESLTLTTTWPDDTADPSLNNRTMVSSSGSV